MNNPNILGDPYHAGSAVVHALRARPPRHWKHGQLYLFQPPRPSRQQSIA